MSHAPDSFDVVHLAHTFYFGDARVRGQARTAAMVTPRVAVLVLSGKDTTSEDRDGTITVIGVPGTKSRRSLAGTMREYLTFLRQTRDILRTDPRFCDVRVVHVHTLPDFLVAAARPARRRGARVFLDLHEIFPEFTQSKMGGWIGRLGSLVAKAIERWSRRQADAVITVNEPIRELLRARPAASRERILVVHNFVLPEELGPAGLTTGAIQSPMRLVYHGTLTRLYGLDLAVGAVRAARDRGIDVTLDLYGEGPVRSELEPELERAGLQNVIRFHAVVRQRRLRELLPTYDAGFVATRLDVMTRYSFSTKLIEYIHLGMPVVAARLPSYERYFPGRCLWYFEPNRLDRAVEAIEHLYRAAPAERVARARDAQAAASRIDRSAEVADLQGLYREALGASQPR